jgi:hypothetical protein
MPIIISRVLLLSSSALVLLSGFGEVAHAQKGQTDIKIGSRPRLTRRIAESH